MIFFAFAIGILGLLHYVLYAHLQAAWPNWAWLQFSVLLCLFATPFLLVFFRHQRMPDIERFFALIGFTWLGVLFVCVSLIGFLRIYDLLVPFFGGIPLSNVSRIWIMLMLAVSGILYGVFEARSPRLKTIAFESAKLPSAASPIRIVQISDLHLGYVANEGRLRALVERINALQPDLIVSTGDLFDGDLGRMAPFAAILAELQAPFGKFAVSGNHEVYDNLEVAMNLTKRSGFTVLRGESISITPELTVVGVDDPEALPGGTSRFHEEAAFERIPDASFVLLLKHQPRILESSLGHFDLQLSGHTHGGQIFPFNILIRIVFHYGPGLSRLDKNSWLYLSRGTGTWGPQFRIFAPPEITLVVLSAP